jgi:hypothetical protein
MEAKTNRGVGRREEKTRGKAVPSFGEQQAEIDTAVWTDYFWRSSILLKPQG